MLILFARRYSAKKSILITGLGFSLLHVINLLGGVDPAFVLRQVVFSAGMGIFYGVLVLRTNSLLPAMLFHFLVNMFIGSFTSYIQRFAPDSTQILYLLINIPFTTLLLITWVKFYSRKWLASSQNQPKGIGDLALEQR
jgi:membrane protease YdiL (CAAX protease family)